MDVLKDDPCLAPQYFRDMFIAQIRLVPWSPNATNGITKWIVGFKLGTTSPLTYGISAVDQRVLLLDCQSRIDDLHHCFVNTFRK